MFKRILTVSAAAILPALALAAPAGAETASSGVTVAAGTITSPSGAPMSGEKVSLFTWPPDAALAALKPGQSVPRKLLATTTTSSTGRYTLQVPQTQMKAAAATTGYVNLEIDSHAGMRFFTYQASPSPQSGEPSGPVTVNLGGRHKKKWPCGHNSKLNYDYGFVGPDYQRLRKPAWAVVGQGYIIRSNKTKGDRVSFKYTKGSSHSQDSSLGVGLSGAGYNVGYTTFGSHTSTATNAESYGAEHRNTWFRTKFNVGQYRGLCVGQHPNDQVPHQHQKGNCPKKYHPGGGAPPLPVHKCLWLLHSRGWIAGASVRHPKKAPHTPRGDCVFQKANSSFDTDRGSAIKWSHGFTLGADLGVKGVGGKVSFNSTAHTGYDSNAFMVMGFPTHKGQLCGTNRTPPHAAILVARGSLPPR